MEENKDISQIIFDRQMRIEKWNQNKLAQEVIFYLFLSLPNFVSDSNNVPFPGGFVSGYRRSRFSGGAQSLKVGSQKNHYG